MHWQRSGVDALSSTHSTVGRGADQQFDVDVSTTPFPSGRCNQAVDESALRQPREHRPRATGYRARDRERVRSRLPVPCGHVDGLHVATATGIDVEFSVPVQPLAFETTIPRAAQL